MPIRTFAARTDVPRLRQCLIELQNFERALDPRMPSGEDIADVYIPDMLKRCRECNGTVLVAEVDNEVAGYVTIMAKVSSEEIGAGDLEFGLVTDIVVMPGYRRTGLGKDLLAAAETYAKANGVKWLRIGALATNHAAIAMYSSMGFSGLYAELEKDLTETA
jgi:GNAT superfamily N-acetyltransferase